MILHFFNIFLLWTLFNSSDYSFPQVCEVSESEWVKFNSAGVHPMWVESQSPCTCWASCWNSPSLSFLTCIASYTGEAAGRITWGNVWNLLLDALSAFYSWSFSFRHSSLASPDTTLPGLSTYLDGHLFSIPLVNSSSSPWFCKIVLPQGVGFTLLYPHSLPWWALSVSGLVCQWLPNLYFLLWPLHQTPDSSTWISDRLLKFNQTSNFLSQIDSFLILVDGVSILSVALALNLEAELNLTLSHPVHLIYEEFLLVLPSKYIRNPSLLMTLILLQTAIISCLDHCKNLWTSLHSALAHRLFTKKELEKSFQDICQVMSLPPTASHSNQSQGPERYNGLQGCTLSASPPAPPWFWPNPLSDLFDLTSQYSSSHSNIPTTRVKDEEARSSLWAFELISSSLYLEPSSRFLFSPHLHQVFAELWPSQVKDPCPPQCFDDILPPSLLLLSLVSCRLP